MFSFANRTLNKSENNVFRMIELNYAFPSIKIKAHEMYSITVAVAVTAFGNRISSRIAGRQKQNRNQSLMNCSLNNNDN